MKLVGNIVRLVKSLALETIVSFGESYILRIISPSHHFCTRQYLMPEVSTVLNLDRINNLAGLGIHSIARTTESHTRSVGKLESAGTSIHSTCILR